MIIKNPINPRVIALSVTLILLSSPPAFSASFDEYIQRLNNHPQIMSILTKSEAIREQAQGELGLPDPVFSIGVDNMPISNSSFDRFIATSKIIGVNQKIPNPALLRAKSDKLEQLSEKQKLIADYTVAKLRFMLFNKLADRKAVKTQMNLVKKQLVYYHELENTFKGQIKSGRAVYQRFSEVDVERAEAERKLNDLEAKLISINAEFVQLLDDIPNIEVPKIVETLWNNNTRELYPILIAAEDINIAKKNVSIADVAFLPNFGVNAVYKQREEGKNGSFAGDDWFSVRAQITLPLWASKNQRPKLKAAKTHERSAQYAYDNINRQWIQKMAEIKAMRDAAAKNIKVLQDKDWAMKSKIKAAQRNYEAGTAELDGVLLARIDRLNIQAQLAQIKAIYISRAAEFNSNIISDFSADIPADTSKEIQE